MQMKFEQEESEQKDCKRREDKQEESEQKLQAGKQDL